jgi:hypothetical protein
VGTFQNAASGNAVEITERDFGVMMNEQAGE